MDILEYIEQEWMPTLGCTEPASIAYASIIAAKQVSGKPGSIALRVDPKMYKNCHAVGIPHSGHTGSESLANLGKIARDGMTHTDDEILRIMEKKL